MGLMSANLKAALRRPGAAPVWLVDLALPGGTKRFAVGGAASATSGHYDGRVLSLGSFGRGVSERLSSLEIYSTEVSVSDSDDALSMVLEGASGNAFRNSAATIRLGEASLAQADWLTCYSGRLDSYGQSAPKTWTLSLRPNDLPLQRDSVPKGIITASDWPRVSKDVEGKRYPIIFGKHDSVSASNQGAVPCLLVDSLLFKYVVGVGALKAVDRVYVDGVPVAGWTASTVTVNGRLLTIVTFTATQGTATITADVQGLTTVSDGSGTLIEDPPTVLKYLLVQFVYNDWKAGAWLADSTAPIDTTTFGITYFSQRGAKASMRLAEKRQGLSAVNECLSSWEAKAFWTTAGKIALKVEDPTSFAYADDPFLRAEDESSWSSRYPTADLIDRLVADWLPDASAGGYRQSLEVRDVSLTEEAPDALDLPWSPAFMV